MKKNNHKGLVGFLLKKNIVRTQLQAYVTLSACALAFYMLSGYILFFNFHNFHSNSAQEFVHRYQLIDQSKFK